MTDYNSEQVARLNADMEMLSARIQGLDSGVVGLEGDVSALADSILTLTQHAAQLAEAIGPVIIAARKAGRPTAPVAVSSTEGPAATDRKVWVAKVPPIGNEEAQVLIEQFGDKPPTVAFRRDSGEVWGRPFPSEEC